MRLNHVAFIGSKVVAVFPFSREHVEVVKPEIVHHLLELPLAVDRARHLGHAQLSHNALRLFAVVGNGARNIVRVAAAQDIAPARAIRRRVRHLLFHWSRSIRIVWRGLWRGNRSRGRNIRICRLPLNILHVFFNDRGSCIGAALFLPRLCLNLFLGLLLHLLGLRIFIDQFRSGHAERRIILEARFHGLVVNGVGI